MAQKSKYGYVLKRQSLSVNTRKKYIPDYSCESTQERQNARYIWQMMNKDTLTRTLHVGRLET